TASATSASSASSTIFRTASLISSLRASPSATPWVSSSLSFWLVRTEAGILVSTGMPPLAARANRRRLVCGPSKSASPSRYPASLGLRPHGPCLARRMSVAAVTEKVSRFCEQDYSAHPALYGLTRFRALRDREAVEIRNARVGGQRPSRKHSAPQGVARTRPSTGWDAA